MNFDSKVAQLVKDDLVIDVSVTGLFELDEANEPDISKPKHDLSQATGLFLKGKRRQQLAEKVSREGVQNVFAEQFLQLRKRE